MGRFIFYKKSSEGNVTTIALYNDDSLPMYKNITGMWSVSFGWGYNGSAIRQLALAILIHVGLEKEKVFNVYLDFLKDFLLDKKDGERLVIEEEKILNWIEKKVLKNLYRNPFKKTPFSKTGMN